MQYVLPPTLFSALQQAEIAIWGLSREGLSTYRFLRRHLPNQQLMLLDDKEKKDLTQEFQQILAEDQTVRFFQTASVEAAPSVVFITPGIPLSHPYREKLLHQKSKITSNTQLFLELAKSCFPHLKTIGVTGTKGKSTTSALIFEVLIAARFPVWLGGNIGTPALDLWMEIATSLEHSSADHWVVLELSCHQLHALTLSPHIAVIQNIVPEHLDYYGTFANYVTAKSHIATHQTAQDFVIFNPKYPIPQQIANHSPAQQLTFATEELPQSLLTKHLIGAHNKENIMPSVILSHLLQVSPELTATTINNFIPLPHRLEYVATANGVEYYNDSLATVPEATLAALAAFENKSVVLIAGGYDRGLELAPFALQLGKLPLRSLILLPSTGTKIAQLIMESSTAQYPILQVKTMTEAVKAAAQTAISGDVVLMSPAAASFNTFKDYQDRGDQFKAAVQALIDD